MLRGWIVVAAPDGNFVYVQVSQITHVQLMGEFTQIHFGNAAAGVLTQETMEEVMRKIGQEKH